MLARSAPEFELPPEYSTAVSLGADSKHVRIRLDPPRAGTRYSPDEKMVLRVKRTDGTVRRIKVTLVGKADARCYEALPAAHLFVVKRVTQAFDNDMDRMSIDVQLPESVSCGECNGGPFELPTSLFLFEHKPGHTSTLAPGGSMKIKSVGWLTSADARRYKLLIQVERDGLLNRNENLSIGFDVAAPRVESPSWRKSRLVKLARPIENTEADLDEIELAYRLFFVNDVCLLSYMVTLHLRKPTALPSAAPLTALLAERSLRFLVARKLVPKPSGNAPALTVPLLSLARGGIEVLRDPTHETLITGARTEGTIEVAASSVIPFNTCLAELRYVLIARFEAIDQSVWLQLFRPEVALPSYSADPAPPPPAVQDTSLLASRGRSQSVAF